KETPLYAFAVTDCTIAGGIQFRVTQVVKGVAAQVQPVYHIIVDTADLITPVNGKESVIKAKSRQHVLSHLNGTLALSAALQAHDLPEKVRVEEDVSENGQTTAKKRVSFIKKEEEKTRYWV